MRQLSRVSRRCSLFATLALAAAFAAPAFSEDAPAKRPIEIAKAEPRVAPLESEEPTAELEPSTAASEPPVYRPPRRGAPRAKVGGGLRGARALPEPLALAPGHLAQTASPQPALFWYIDAVPAGPVQIVFTLIDAEGVDPVVEASLDPPTRAGIHRIRLADHGVELEPGVEYEWSIAVVVDPAQRARDVVTTGYIQRVAQPASLEGAVATAARYAAAGLWYDALETISDSIREAPDDVELRRHRSGLLRQAGLGAAVE